MHVSTFAGVHTLYTKISPGHICYWQISIDIETVTVYAPQTTTLVQREGILTIHALIYSGY